MSAPDEVQVTLTLQLVSEGEDPGDSTKYLLRYKALELETIGLATPVFDISVPKSVLKESQSDDWVVPARLHRIAKMFLTGVVDSGSITMTAE